MIAYLEGKVVLKADKFIVLDVQGVGYKIFLSQKALTKITREGENLKLFCFLNVGQNILDLYGFPDNQELELFKFLNDIRGIGPKAALEVSSVAPLRKMKEAIKEKNEKILGEIAKIGEKKAQAIIFELSKENQDNPLGTLIPEDENFEQ